jgi:hypothetical protein
MLALFDGAIRYFFVQYLVRSEYRGEDISRPVGTPPPEFRAHTCSFCDGLKVLITLTF